MILCLENRFTHSMKCDDSSQHGDRRQDNRIDGGSNEASISDREILRRVCQGEHPLFDLLVQRYWQPLRRVAESKLGDPGWAEDVTQEALFSAFRSRQTYNPAFAVRTWLWTILLNACRRHGKSRKRKERASEQTIDAANVVASTALTGLENAVLGERREVLESQLRRISEVQADAIRLRFFGELKYQEIASAMGCSLNTAKHRVKTGLQTLANLLNHESRECP